jgi:hypothetical protein
LVSISLEQPAKPSFSAAQIDHRAAWRRENLTQCWPCAFPEAVMTWSTRPGDPLPGIAFPGVGKVHDVTVTDDRRMQFATAAATGP